MKIDSGGESSSTCSSSNNLAPASSVGHPQSGASSSTEKIKGKSRRRNHGDTQTLCRSCAEDRKDSALADLQCGAESDGEEEDDDDVFLESWEEVASANGQCSHAK